MNKEFHRKCWISIGTWDDDLLMKSFSLTVDLPFVRTRSEQRELVEILMMEQRYGFLGRLWVNGGWQSLVWKQMFVAGDFIFPPDVVTSGEWKRNSMSSDGLQESRCGPGENLVSSHHTRQGELDTESVLRKTWRCRWGNSGKIDSCTTKSRIVFYKYV